MLKKKTDTQVLRDIKIFAKRERECTAMVLEHLAEVRERKLYAELKHKDLVEYAIKELHYSESSARRRISALKQTVEQPELVQKIASGEMTLGMLGDLQAIFQLNALSEEEKKNLIDSSFGKTQEEFRNQVKEKTHESSVGGFLPTRPLVLPKRFLKFIASSELENKFKKVHGLLISKNCRSKEDVLNYLLDRALHELIVKEAPKSLQASPDRVLKSVTPKMRREVLGRDGRRCQNCGSEFQLEVDHIRPKARGGTNQIANLRCLCRSCNQRAAIKVSK